MTKSDMRAEESAERPLVATLLISSSAQDYFNQLRQQHFPADRNYLDAHLTLFHALPDQPWVIEDLSGLAKEHTPFNVKAEAVVSLGRGTAFKIVSPELSAIHQTLRKRWHDRLTAQDQQKRNFHITIQNKVEPHIAKKLQSELTPSFEPFEFAVSGIHLWRYLGGPWEYVTTIYFDHFFTSPVM
ncbi:2'-5' RNA ligase family protein [Dyadobacter sp. CY347]|uniref:2'-5' RNA ligase family protein n=1 Tax=Dyadobacter sp. CY347 TaxID=2909336 RepID=UPI001F37082F|nr:2'-5' RNA ligase family protein [Dyadobacter sp. CY347]MCF2489250.1 2'-5' RNA ligase family protein [Dyadobacter sp. CY347]